MEGGLRARFTASVGDTHTSVARASPRERAHSRRSRLVRLITFGRRSSLIKLGTENLVVGLELLLLPAAKAICSSFHASFNEGGHMHRMPPTATKSLLRRSPKHGKKHGSKHLQMHLPFLHACSLDRLYFPLQVAGVLLKFCATVVPELQHLIHLLHDFLLFASLHQQFHRVLVITLRIQKTLLDPRRSCQAQAGPE